MTCKLALLGFITVFIQSCSDDFLTKRWEAHGQGIYNTPTIYVSSDEEARVYPIIWEDAGNATFTIINKPDWLKVESMVGQFMDGMAEVTCSAIRNKSFTDSKIYLSDMTIEVEGVGKGIVDVGYINNGVSVSTGNPVFFCEGIESIDFGKTETVRPVVIIHLGSGVLIWKVTECPEWINMKTQDFLYYGNKMTEIICNRSGLPEGNHEGSITFSTNDKNQPTYTITVRCQVGDE